MNIIENLPSRRIFEDRYFPTFSVLHKVSSIEQMLSQRNQIVRDIEKIEPTLPFSHRVMWFLDRIRWMNIENNGKTFIYLPEVEHQPDKDPKNAHSINIFDKTGEVEIELPGLWPSAPIPIKSLIMGGKDYSYDKWFDYRIYEILKESGVRWPNTPEDKKRYDPEFAKKRPWHSSVVLRLIRDPINRVLIRVPPKDRYILFEISDPLL